MKKNAWLKKFVLALITLTAAGYFFWSLLQNFESLPEIQWGFRSFGVLVLSVILSMASIWVLGSIWFLLLRENKVSVELSHSLVIVAISQFGKYLPGNVGHHVGRAIMAKKAGIPSSVVLSTMSIELLWGAAVGAGLSFVSMLVFVDMAMLSEAMSVGALHVLLLFACLSVGPWLSVKFLHRFSPNLLSRLIGDQKLIVPNFFVSTAVALLFVLCFFITGLIMKIQVESLFGISGVSVLELGCLFAVAWLAGYLVPGAPGGIGVREALMVALFTPILGPGVSIGVSVSMRLTTTLADGSAFLIGVAARKYTDPKVFYKKNIEM